MCSVRVQVRVHALHHGDAEILTFLFGMQACVSRYEDIMRKEQPLNFSSLLNTKKSFC